MLVVQLGNAVAFGYVAVTERARARASPAATTHVLVTTALVTALLLSRSWNVYDALTPGRPGSLRLLVAMAVAGVVGCVGVVVVYPLAAAHEPAATSALSAGMGANALVAALLAAAQGVAATPARFSVDAYFLAIAGVLGLSLAASLGLATTRLGAPLRLVDVPRSSDALPDALIAGEARATLPSRDR